LLDRAGYCRSASDDVRPKINAFVDLKDGPMVLDSPPKIQRSPTIPDR
jgi:hypothetical protein